MAKQPLPVAKKAITVDEDLKPHVRALWHRGEPMRPQLHFGLEPLIRFAGNNNSFLK